MEDDEEETEGFRMEKPVEPRRKRKTLSVIIVSVVAAVTILPILVGLSVWSGVAWWLILAISLFLMVCAVAGAMAGAESVRRRVPDRTQEHNEKV
jgi:VIT1/CCC1 family predicted Fe2+/Mn2+ transporter